MASGRAANRRHQRSFLARRRVRGLRRLTLRVPPGHVAAHRAAAAGRPRELERLRDRVEAEVRGHVLHRLDRWNRMALRRAARAEARMHPAGSNAPPARVRFGHRPAEGFRKRLREAGWWYDWIAAVWHLPEDPARWAAAEALAAEAEAAGVPVGAVLAHAMAIPANSAAVCHQREASRPRHRAAGRAAGAAAGAVAEDARAEGHGPRLLQDADASDSGSGRSADLKGPTPDGARDRTWPRTGCAAFESGRAPGTWRRTGWRRGSRTPWRGCGTGWPPSWRRRSGRGRPRAWRARSRTRGGCRPRSPGPAIRPAPERRLSPKTRQARIPTQRLRAERFPVR